MRRLALRRLSHAGAGLVALGLLLVVLSPSDALAGTEERRSAKGVEYTIRVPEAAEADAGGAGLLVVALQGRLDVTRVALLPTLAGVEKLAGAVIVAPRGEAGQGPEGNASESFSPADLVDLIREVRGQHKCTRTVVLGWSMMAFLAPQVATEDTGATQAVIIHSGLFGPIGATASRPATQPLYVIHGAADTTMPAAAARDGVKKLEAAGFKVKYDEVAGLEHALDPAAIGRAFDWIETALGGPARPPRPPLTDAEAKAQMAALDKAVKAKDPAAAVAAFAELARAPASMSAKIADIAKTHATGADDEIAKAAIRAALKLKEAGLPALKAAIKGKSLPVSLAAAEALGRLGGEGATALLIEALGPAEAAKAKVDLVREIHASLGKITGKSFDTAREWKKWAADQKKR